MSYNYKNQIDQVLRTYIKISNFNQQLRFNEGYNGSLTNLYAPKERPLPFMFCKSAEPPNFLAEAKLVQTSGLTDILETDFLSYFSANISITYYAGVGMVYYVCKGDVDFSSNLSPGTYYFRFKDNVGTEWETEVFEVLDDVSDLMLLEFTNDKDIGEILYQTGFKQKLYVGAAFSESEHKKEEKVQMRNGMEIIEEEVSMEVLVLNMFVPKFVWQAVKNIKLHSSVKLYDKSANGYVYTMKNIDIEKPDFSTSPLYCLLTIKFIAETLVSRNTNLNMS